jgi:hypothetical protein
MTEFDYDLNPGIDEGIVNVTLTVGDFKYCSSFDDFNDRDGSDGKTFLGKNSPAPGPPVCP